MAERWPRTHIPILKNFCNLFMTNVWGGIDTRAMQPTNKSARSVIHARTHARVHTNSLTKQFICRTGQLVGMYIHIHTHIHTCASDDELCSEVEMCGVTIFMG